MAQCAVTALMMSETVDTVIDDRCVSWESSAVIILQTIHKEDVYEQSDSFCYIIRSAAVLTAGRYSSSSTSFSPLQTQCDQVGCGYEVLPTHVSQQRHGLGVVSAPQHQVSIGQ